jgi:type IV pilus assembly protein PilW
MSLRTRHQGGFTIIELLVGMALALVMTAIIASVFGRASRATNVTQTVNEIQEQGRVALDMLQRDVRSAGYIGCNSNRLIGSGALVNNIATPTGYRNKFDEYLMGFEGTGASFSPAADAGLATASPAALRSSDALTIRIPATDPVSLSAAMTAGTGVVPVFSTTGFAVGQRAIIGDCGQSTAFYVTGLAGGLQHSASAGTNSSADFAYTYGIDAMVVPFSTLTYYLAANGVGTTRSLYRRVDGAATSEQIAEGVEDFQVQYGVDTDSDNAADLFVSADAVADWQRVVSVRASLLMRSKLDNAAQNTQAYDFNGSTGIVAADKRLRRPFDVSIQLRNRTQ